MQIYKHGQGYWTRMMSGIAGGFIVVMGVMWLASLMQNVSIGGLQPLYVAMIVGIPIVLILGGIIYYLVAIKPKTVDFLIATEGEMKKVNWSSRKEVFGSTQVVIGFCVLITLFVYFFDFIFASFFSLIRVLEISGS